MNYSAHSFVLFLTTLLLAATGPQALAQSVVASESYKLSPVDQIEMSVFGRPKLKTKQRLDGEGKVSLPLLGSIQIGGLSLAQAESAIARAYQEERYLRDPSVTLAIIEYAPKAVTVMGEVEEPGEVKFVVEENKISLPSAIAKAGGFTNTAKKSSVKVVREGDSGNKISYRVDVSDAFEDGADSLGSRGYLEPGDTVVVPRRIF